MLFSQFYNHAGIIDQFVLSHVNCQLQETHMCSVCVRALALCGCSGLSEYADVSRISESPEKKMLII